MHRTFARKSLASILLTATVLSGVGESLALDPPIQAPNKRVRERMALVHEKMAACLRSEKPYSKCQGELQKDCMEMMGESGCPMMGLNGQRMSIR
jgi:hypothetical protein